MSLFASDLPERLPSAFDKPLLFNPANSDVAAGWKRYSPPAFTAFWLLLAMPALAALGIMVLLWGARSIYQDSQEREQLRTSGVTTKGSVLQVNSSGSRSTSTYTLSYRYTIIKDGTRTVLERNEPVSLDTYTQLYQAIEEANARKRGRIPLDVVYLPDQPTVARYKNNLGFTGPLDDYVAIGLFIIVGSVTGFVLVLQSFGIYQQLKRGEGRILFAEVMHWSPGKESDTSRLLRYRFTSPTSKVIEKNTFVTHSTLPMTIQPGTRIALWYLNDKVQKVL